MLRIPIHHKYDINKWYKLCSHTLQSLQMYRPLRSGNRLFVCSQSSGESTLLVYLFNKLMLTVRLLIQIQSKRKVSSILLDIVRWRYHSFPFGQYSANIFFSVKKKLEKSGMICVRRLSSPLNNRFDNRNSKRGSLFELSQTVVYATVLFTLQVCCSGVCKQSFLYKHPLSVSLL